MSTQPLRTSRRDALERTVSLGLWYPSKRASNDPRRAISPKPPASTPTLPTGSRLLEYRIDSVLGQGGFGVAYTATDVNLNARVVIKEYFPEEVAYRTVDHALSAREDDFQEFFQLGLDHFLVEARALATFRHPSIVRVARFFEANNTAYMVLEHERGPSLAEWRKGQALLPEARIVELFAPLMDGLSVVHEAGYLHCDVKPDNICVRNADGSLVLLDFGAARHTTSTEAEIPDVLTPGYGPIEQYAGGGRQGPWTDIYSLGATLYWLVSGMKPLDAATRLEQPEQLPPAELLGKGRYSPAFLKAIDWSLAIHPEERPQSIEEFRKALFSAHPTALALQDALRTEDDDDPASGWRTILTTPRLLKRRLARVAHALLEPRSWPFAAKLMLAMGATALVPMVITAAYNMERTSDHVSDVERRNLEQLAHSTGARIAQLLNDTRNLADYVWSDDDFARYLSRPTPTGRAEIVSKLEGLVRVNADLQFTMLMDADGSAVISTDPEVQGKNFRFRDYFKAAMAGRPYMTGIIVGSVAGEPGIFYSRPVRGVDGRSVGALVIRIKAAAVGEILAEAGVDIQRVPFLVDRDGVIVWHLDERHRFKSLRPLPDNTLAEIRADRRFRRDNIESMGEEELAQVMIGARSHGALTYNSRVHGVDAIAGFAPVPGYDWVVGVSESRAAFVAPIERLYSYVLLSVMVVGVIFLVIAILLARTIVRPIEQITAATNALKRGDYDHASIAVRSSDEIGRLARAFNVMIDVMRQRERERTRSVAPGPGPAPGRPSSD